MLVQSSRQSQGHSEFNHWSDSKSLCPNYQGLQGVSAFHHGDQLDFTSSLQGWPTKRLRRTGWNTTIQMARRPRRWELLFQSGSLKGKTISGCSGPTVLCLVGPSQQSLGDGGLGTGKRQRMVFMLNQQLRSLRTWRRNPPSRRSWAFLERRTSGKCLSASRIHR